MNTESFVYKWTNIVSGKIYIGKHKGTEDDGYISSGKVFLACYYANPHEFKREIIFWGTDYECLKEEGKLIKEAIRLAGYTKLYNQTHWHILKEWKRTCLHCGAIVDPRNEEWASAFALEHFENCQSIKPIKEKKKKQTMVEWRANRMKKLEEEKLKKTSQMKIKAKKPAFKAPVD